MGLSPKWRSDLLIILGITIYTLLSIIIPKILKEKNKISKFTARKIIHSFSGLGVLSAPYLNFPFLAFLFALLMTALVRLSNNKSKAKPLKELYNAISEDEELKLGYLQGPYAYCLAISILVFAFIFFSDKFYIPISSILTMMYADTFAAFIGRRYGKHHIDIPWVGNKRTLEGSASFFTVSIILSLFVFFFFGKILPGNSMILTGEQVILLSFLLSIVSTILELLSPSKYDDIIVPLGSTLIVSLIMFVLNVW